MKNKAKFKYHRKWKGRRKRELRIYDDELLKLKVIRKSCAECGRTLDSGARNVRCVKCQGRHSIRKKELYEKRKALGQCVNCGLNVEEGHLNIEEGHLCNKCKHKRAEYRLAIKEEVLNSYGGKCACCGENNLLFLTLDHIYNDGSQHRKKLMAIGNGFYLKIRKLGYPKGSLQILCWNCHYAKTYFGVCPHKEVIPTSHVARIEQ